MVNKTALLVGCNYQGSSAPLNGCINDVMSMRQMLIDYFGFAEANIKIMIDTDPSYPSPTGKAIKDGLTELVTRAAPGDYVFFHFSGHGTLVPADHDPHEQELSGQDQAICPTDMNLILDDDLNAIVAQLVTGAHFTMVADCCHSGSMLDHPVQRVAGNKDPNAPPTAASLPVPDLMGMFGMKSAPAQADVKNRGLMPSQFAQMFNLMKGGSGGGGMSTSNMRGMLEKQFGADASRKAVGAAQQLDKWLATSGAKTLGNAEAVGFLRKILACFSSAMAAPAGTTAPTTTTTGPPPPVRLGAEVGVLISGCQDKETSADACPSGDPKQAFGALTNALTTVIKAQRATDKSALITTKQLTEDVRELLLKGGFAQNPCLSCSEANCNAPFICP